MCFCFNGKCVFFNEYIFYANLGDLTSCLSVFGLGSDPSKVKINLNCGYGYEVVLTNGYGYFSNVTVTSKHGQGGFWIKNGASLEVKDCRMVSSYDKLLVDLVCIADSYPRTARAVLELSIIRAPL